MQSFESCRPSQPVQFGLRVGNWATEAPFRPLVSEATFWCLVFAGINLRLLRPARVCAFTPSRIRRQKRSPGEVHTACVFAQLPAARPAGLTCQRASQQERPVRFAPSDILS